jgi:hypothetical protein
VSSGCPACGRPVALLRATCLYCGATLPPAARLPDRPPGEQVGHVVVERPAVVRELLVLELAGVEPDALARATGLSQYEADLLARKGGFQLYRALPPAQAAEAAERLAAERVPFVRVPEAEARAQPLRVTSGAVGASALLLRGESGPLEVAAADLLIVVTGAIRREHPARSERRRVDTAAEEEGWLAHLHRLSDTRPVEVDAANFALDFAVAGAPWLELVAWIDALPDSVVHDDAFRTLTPALAPAEPEAKGPVSAASSLRRRGARSAARAFGPQEAGDGPALLDNVAQFRFYSGWRAAVERRRRSRIAGAAC